MKLMNGMRAALLSVMVLFGFSTAAQADLLVIVNAENDSKVDVRFVRNLYLGKDDRFDNGDKATPLMLSEDDPLTELFLKEILKQKPVQFKRLWSKALFTGEGTPPEELSSDEAVLRAVIGNPSAIGFIDSKNYTNEVRAVLRIKTQ